MLVLRTETGQIMQAQALNRVKYVNTTCLVQDALCIRNLMSALEVEMQALRKVIRLEIINRSIIILPMFQIKAKRLQWWSKLEFFKLDSHQPVPSNFHVQKS